MIYTAPNMPPWPLNANHFKAFIFQDLCQTFGSRLTTHPFLVDTHKDGLKCKINEKTIL